MKEPDSPGYIDPSRPHTINHILVDDLGVDEVLLLATDSGNVTGYNVEAIFSAISRCVKFEHTRPFDGVEVKPFFTENVSLSAWGLATHKFARLIAVSSNTGLITVFAFAIADEASDDESISDSTEAFHLPNLDGSEQPWLFINTLADLRELKKQMPNHRRRNLRLRYTGHFENIPCVSFANFDLDPNGTWMVSTDIANRVIIWNVWDGLSPTKASVYGTTGRTDDERGWFVLPIDPRRVQRHRFKIDACGCEPEEKMLGGRIVFDTTTMIEHLTDWSPIMGLQVSKPEVTYNPLPDDIFSPDCLVQPNPRKRFSSPEHDSSSSEPLPNFSANMDGTADLDSSSIKEIQPDFVESSHSEEPEMTEPVHERGGIPDLIEEENEHLNAPPPQVADSPSSVIEPVLYWQERHAFHRKQDIVQTATNECSL